MAKWSEAGWESTSLGDAAIWHSGGTPSTKEPAYWGGNIPWISSRTLTGFFLEDSDRCVTPLGARNGTKLVPSDTTIVVVRGMSLRTEWRVGITTREVAFGQDCKALIANDRFDPLFFAYATLGASREVLRLVERSGHGTGRLSTAALRRVQLPVPPPAEQRAIAHVLRTVQRAKQATKQVIAAARELKPSLARHLLSYGPVRVDETDSVVRTESPVGDIPDAWDVRVLGDVVEIQRGQVDPRMEPYASMLHVGPDNIESRMGRIHRTKTAKELRLISGKYLFDPGWVLYSKIRPYLRKAAQPDFVGICSADMYPLRASGDRLRQDFLFHYLLSDCFTRQAISYQSRTGIPKINRLQLSQVLIPLPDIESQHTIALHLSAIDQKIAAEEARRDALSSLFDSLLRDLMSARRRVTDAVVPA